MSHKIWLRRWGLSALLMSGAMLTAHGQAPTGGFYPQPSPTYLPQQGYVVAGNGVQPVNPNAVGYQQPMAYAANPNINPNAVQPNAAAMMPVYQPPFQSAPPMQPQRRVAQLTGAPLTGMPQPEMGAIQGGPVAQEFLGNPPSHSMMMEPSTIEHSGAIETDASSCNSGSCGSGSGGEWCIDPCEPPLFGGPSNNGFFFTGEAMLLFIDRPQTSVFGDPGSEGLVTVNGVTYLRENSLDTSWMQADGAWGQRFEFGNIGCDAGWFTSIWSVKQTQSYTVSGVQFQPMDPFFLMSGFSDGNGDDIDDDLDGDNIYGRNGQDLGTFAAGPPAGFTPPFDGQPDIGAPIDTGDLVYWLNTFATVRSSNKLRMSSFELNRLVRNPGHCWNSEWNYFYGIRYMRVSDIYDVTAAGNFLDASFWHAESDNNLIGPQFGARWLRRTNAIGFSVDGRFMAAYNRQDNDLRGQTASNAVPGGVNGPVSLTANSFTDSFGDDAFAPVGELRADMTLKISRRLAFKVGYTGLVAGGISRSSPKIVYALPSSRLQDVASNDTLVAHGATLGFEFNR